MLLLLLPLLHPCPCPGAVLPRVPGHGAGFSPLRTPRHHPHTSRPTLPPASAPLPVSPAARGDCPRLHDGDNKSSPRQARAQGWLIYPPHAWCAEDSLPPSHLLTGTWISVETGEVAGLLSVSGSEDLEGGSLLIPSLETAEDLEILDTSSAA